jgi:alkylation response protein AidB-like acyl-CoA dehydrogenase
MSVNERASGWVDELREHAPAIEAGRRVPQELSDRLGADGFFRMLVPASLGGGEVHPREFAAALQTLARGDGAAGWLAMTGSTTGLLTAYLPETGARAVLEGAPHAALAGVFAPSGRATPVDGGYRLSGRWAFGSGCENATWRVGGALVFEGDAPRKLPSGGPEIRSFFFRADESKVEDTWRTAGLRGTGSHHMSVEDVVVPAERSTCILADVPAHEGALYRFPVFGLLATGVASVGLGIASHALELGLEMARSKRSRGGGKLMGESEIVQVELATAQGELGAAEAFLRTTLDAAWAQAERTSEPLGEEARARLRLAATHAARSAAAVTDRVYHLCGGASIWDSNPLSRCFRDVHVMTQHVMVSPATLKPIGRIALGLPTDSSML